MALLLNTQNLAKSYGANPLFRNLSLNLSEGDRLGLVGSNGSGKSTLLEILAGRRQPDTGEVAFRKNTRVRYVPQDSTFARGESVKQVIRRALDQSTLADNEAAENERHAREAETLGRAGFRDFDQETAARQSADTALANRATALETKTQFVSVDSGEMYVTGTNLHIVNGLGATNGNPADPVDRLEYYDETNTHRVPTAAGKALEAKYGRLRWLHPG